MEQEEETRSEAVASPCVLPTEAVNGYRLIITGAAGYPDELVKQTCERLRIQLSVNEKAETEVIFPAPMARLD